MSVLVVGSVALDTIKTPFGKVKDVLGGSASYFSVSASLFTSVNLVAVVGQDFSKKHFQLFKRKGINLRGLSVENGNTFSWEGEYGWDFSDPRTIATNLNVFANFDPKIPQEYIKSKYVFLANIDPEIQEKVLCQISQPKIVACDTMNYWIEKKPKQLLKLLKKVDIFLLNESEARELTCEPNLIKAGRKILKFGPKVIVIKKGSHGVLLFTKNNIFAIPAFLLETVFDPTGAGDTFAGGFMGYLAKCSKFNQASLKKSLIYGSIMATFAVEDFSLNKLSRVNMADVITRIKKFKASSCF